MIILSIVISFISVALLAFCIGFYCGLTEVKALKVEFKQPVDKVKVLKKSEPKTFVEKRTEAMDSGKKIIKTFSK